MVMLGFKRDWMRNSAECRQYVDILFAGFRHNLSIGILRVKSGFDYSKIIASEEVSYPHLRRSRRDFEGPFTEFSFYLVGLELL